MARTLFLCRVNGGVIGSGSLCLSKHALARIAYALAIATCTCIMHMYARSVLLPTSLLALLHECEALKHAHDGYAYAYTYTRVRAGDLSSI